MGDESRDWGATELFSTRGAAAAGRRSLVFNTYVAPSLSTHRPYRNPLHPTYYADPLEWLGLFSNLCIPGGVCVIGGSVRH